MSQFKYKPGDKVKVRPNLDLHTKYGMYSSNFATGINDIMLKLVGKTVTITGTRDNGYKIDADNSDWNWTDEMFIPITKWVL